MTVRMEKDWMYLLKPKEDFSCENLKKLGQPVQSLHPYQEPSLRELRCFGDLLQVVGISEQENGRMHAYMTS